jgi:putative intracellular protease/amidase
MLMFCRAGVRRDLTSGFSSYNEAMTINDNYPMEGARLVLKNIERIAWRSLYTWHQEALYITSSVVSSASPSNTITVTHW